MRAWVKITRFTGSSVTHQNEINAGRICSSNSVFRASQKASEENSLLPLLRTLHASNGSQTSGTLFLRTIEKGNTTLNATQGSHNVHPIAVTRKGVFLLQMQISLYCSPSGHRNFSLLIGLALLHINPAFDALYVLFPGVPLTRFHSPFYIISTKKLDTSRLSPPKLYKRLLSGSGSRQGFRSARTNRKPNETLNAFRYR